MVTIKYPLSEELTRKYHFMNGFPANWNRFFYSIKLDDFRPINGWELYVEGPKKRVDDQPKFLVDLSTGRLYWNESKALVRFKCFLLLAAVPTIFALQSLFDTICKIVNLITFSHFYKKTTSHEDGSLRGRVVMALKDTTKIFSWMVILPILELFALYGLFSPYDGRKLFATFSKIQYDWFIVGGCFQPINHIPECN